MVRKGNVMYDHYNWLNSSFEHRQFIGEKVIGTDFTKDKKLVLVAGIYYRYVIDNDKLLDLSKTYIIENSIGNILTLRQQ